MSAQRVVLWGTCDFSKPRSRILLQALKASGITVEEIHADVWSGERDKSQIDSWSRRIAFLARWLAAYPCLIWRYLRAPRHDAVLVGYLGQLDVLILWPFAALRGVPVVWDMFISLYDTIVFDRSLVRPGHPLALLLWAWEWMACRAARIVIMDTRAHAHHVAGIFRLSPSRTSAVPVGVELDSFPRAADKPARAPEARLRVLFYGQFIPVHGIETIVKAASLARDLPIQWTLIGSGQESAHIDPQIADARLGDRLVRIAWVDYDALHQHIADADVCLGIFGTSAKAANAIPNKAYQILAVGRPLVTRDSPAIRELVDDTTPGVKLVPADDAEALLQAVLSCQTEGLVRPPSALRERSSSTAVGASLRTVIEGART